MQPLRRLRFRLRSVVLLVLFITMSFAILSQLRRIENLQGQVRDLRANLESPIATVRAVSFIEVGGVKQSGQHFMNKVFIAEDGRKRVESLTSKRGLVSIYDDVGIQRLYLHPGTQTATVFEAVEEFGGGADLHDWIRVYQQLSVNPEKELGRRELNGKTARGFLTKQNGSSYAVWVNDATGEPLQVESDDKGMTTQMFDIQYHDALNEVMFSFEAPEAYNVVERHTAK
jgi:outer membrane lipoprotein-sorting protein